MKRMTNNKLFCLKMCTGSETLHCHIVSDPVYLICSEFSCLYFINSLMISLIISSSSGVSIPLKWLPAAAVWRILSAICSTISSFTASSAASDVYKRQHQKFFSVCKIQRLSQQKQCCRNDRSHIKICQRHSVPSCIFGIQKKSQSKKSDTEK